MTLERKLKLNENEVRFKGRFPVKEDIEPMKDYSFLVKGQLIEITEHDNQDGSFDARYTIGITDVEVIKE